MASPHKGHHKRGYLPHRDFAGSVQGITFRLHDSIPKHILTRWRSELAALADEDHQRELRRKIAQHEDQGLGSCLLQSDVVATIVQDKLIQGHNTSYRLDAWCIMPNHVHVLLRQEDSLSKIIQQWKGATAHAINQHLNRQGQLWAEDYFDRVIRDEDHYWDARAYIHRNPVQAGLCENPKDWPWSSAHPKWSADFSPPRK